MIPFVQVTAPNVNVSGTSGWCLQYVDDAVKAPQTHRAPSAQQSWDNAVANNTAHPNEEPPNNVWVPVYYTIENGQYAGLGHVAWYYSDGKTTKIYDSEYASGKRNKPYGSGAELISYMGWQMRYLGWSEVVDGLRVVKAQPNEQPKPNKSQPTVKGEEEVILYQIYDKSGSHKGKWFVSNGTHLRYIRTPRVLDGYKKQGYPIDVIYSSELFGDKGEFPTKNVIW